MPQAMNDLFQAVQWFDCNAIRSIYFLTSIFLLDKKRPYHIWPIWVKAKSGFLTTSQTLISYVVSYENGVKYHFRFEYIILNPKMSNGKFA